MRSDGRGAFLQEGTDGSRKRDTPPKSWIDTTTERTGLSLLEELELEKCGKSACQDRPFYRPDGP